MRDGMKSRLSKLEECMAASMPCDHQHAPQRLFIMPSGVVNAHCLRCGHYRDSGERRPSLMDNLRQEERMEL